MLRHAVVVAILAGGCGHDHGAPRVRPPPKADGSPALRGGGPPKTARIASYKIDAQLDVTKHLITATETLTWTNPGDSAVDTLPFHLYLNAFKNESSLFMRSSRGELRGARASDTGWGWIKVDSVVTRVGEDDGKLSPDSPELVTKLKPIGLPDETVAELPLGQPLQPHKLVEVSFKFTAQLPEVFARTGYKGEFHMVGQWFPKIGVRVGPPGAERWECQPLHANTEFFADFGSYDVTLTVPNSYVVVGTGVLTDAHDAGDGRTRFSYRAEDVHDFAWMADPYMEMTSKHAKLDDGTVEVRVYARPEQREFARRHLDAAVGTIERFSSWFQPYPWPIMSVIDPPVDAVDGAGGMEYPTLVTTAGDTVFARPGVRLPEYVTVHEVGHNWFQGMLASNEAEEAWLDEGVNEWADARAMTELYGARASGVDWMGWQAEEAALRRAVAADPRSLPSPIATAAYAFVDSASYGEQTYTTTLRALRTLEHMVGSDRFNAAMKAYAHAWVWKHPTGRDLYAALGKELGTDLDWFFGPVFHEVGGVGFAVRTAACRTAHPPRGIFNDGATKKVVTELEAPETGSFVCEVVISNTGVMHVPVDIDLKFADGSTLREHWDDRGSGNWVRFVVERSSKLVEVWIDPEDKLELDSPVGHHTRLDGDAAASLRAAAWVSTLTQTLMQIVGP